MAAFLDGLGLKNYRGIGADEQFMAPFRRFNIFIGANNSGKSSVLNFISKHLEKVGSATNSPFDDHELHGSATSVDVSIGIPVDTFISKVQPIMHYGDRRGILQKFADCVAVNKVVWVKSTMPGTEGRVFHNVRPDKLVEILDGNEWANLWHSFTNQYVSDMRNVPSSIMNRTIGLQDLAFAPAKLIPAFREIGPKNESFSEYNGRGLIDRLAALQSPSWGNDADRKLFDKINLFVQQVTGNNSSQIEIPSERETINVRIDDKPLPLVALGTGIQEVIMIAAFCTMSEKQIVCIEEPEIHLHPLLQKKLLKYLDAQTSNQYFIATHSPSFIDAEGAAIFHVRNENGESRIFEAILRKNIYAICDDLGHKASELAQSNSVIWVEGPTDRIYLKHWIEAVSPDLREGIHYSVMFYGGRLLSHIAVEPEELNDFIALRALNRNVAILIDSDKTSARAKVNETKARVAKEFVAGGCVAWITKGREIENYIPHAQLQAAVKRVYSTSYGKPGASDQYSHALYFKPLPGSRKRPKKGMVEITEIDKVAVAKQVIKSPADLDVLDLRKKLKEIIAMIRRANDL